MLYIKPDYYDDFHCVADQCEDTCCAGWQIVVDEESLDRYRKEKGPFRRQLHRGIWWRKKVFHQDRQKRCAFLNEENLCDMYAALGEDSLCQTCQRYPRHIEEFENVRETTLSISCPVVARYLMARAEPVEIQYEETDQEENCADFEEMDFDVLLYDILEEARNLMIEILQDRSRSMKVRCERILHLAAELEDKIDAGEAFTCYELFDKYKEGKDAFQKRRLKRSMDYSSRVLGALFRMERLREEWEGFLSECACLLFLNGEEMYQNQSQSFEKWQKEQVSLEIPLEQLAVYFVMTYFCGAVYDGKILAKVQAAIVCLYIIRELCKASWIKNNGTFDQEDLVEIVYRFSRELEHSDHNLEWMEKMAAAAMPVRLD